MNIINATNVNQCAYLQMKYITTHPLRFFKRWKIKKQIEAQFLMPMEADNRKFKI